MHEGVEADASVKVRSSTRSHEGRLLKIDLDEVELPGGKVARLESIRHPGAAAVLPFLANGNVLLIRQYRHAMGGWILEVPAGKLDDGEPPAECAVREVEEEVGHQVGALLELGAIFTTPGFTDEVIWLYEAHDLTATRLAHEEDEVIEVVEMEFDEAVRRVRDGEIRDGKTVATLLHAALRRSVPPGGEKGRAS
jgi:ADP-ribose pyrophosphatase